MTGNLDTALKTLITESLPGLFGGTAPAVQVNIASDLFEVDSPSVDAIASEPRPDDRTDRFAFDVDHPAGPYTLSQPPYPGPSRAWLMTDTGERMTLRADELAWDEADSRIFSLDLRSNRHLAGVTHVQVLYAVTAIFTTINALQTLTVQLQSPHTDRLQQAEALVIAVIELNRQQIVDAAHVIYEDGIYGAQMAIKSLKLIKGTRPAADLRLITLQTEFELKANRALSEQEGRPIQHIRTPGRPLSERPVDIVIDVEA